MYGHRGEDLPPVLDSCASLYTCAVESEKTYRTRAGREIPHVDSFKGLKDSSDVREWKEQDVGVVVSGLT